MGTVVLVIGLLLCAVACVMWATETHLSHTPPTTPEPRAPIHPQNPPDPRAAIQYDNHRDRPTEFLPNTRLRADRPVGSREPTTPPRTPSGVSGSHRTPPAGRGAGSPTVYVPILGTNLHCPGCRCADRS